MVSFKFIIVLFSVMFAMVVAAPGGWGGSHKHVVIHVPHHVHTVHHHHVKKVHVPVPVPVIKKVFIHEAHPIIEHGGWW